MTKRLILAMTLMITASAVAQTYHSVLPPDGKADSYLILIPGFGESPEDVLLSTTLPGDAAKEGIAVFIPILQDGTESYSFSPKSQQCLKQIVQDIRHDFGLSRKPYFVGGFSMGGGAAIRYAETADDKPQSVFAIDSPLDFERFYYATLRDVHVYKKDAAIYGKLLRDICDIMGGTPAEAIGNYHRISPYSLADTTHTAILPLVNVPVRVYIEPAEQWWLDNRQTDALGLNIIDATAFINDLRLLGNENAELIVTHDKGYRNHGKTRHPHSWTIVDNLDLIKWMKRLALDSDDVKSNNEYTNQGKNNL